MPQIRRTQLRDFATILARTQRRWDDTRGQSSFSLRSFTSSSPTQHANMPTGRSSHHCDLPRARSADLPNTGGNRFGLARIHYGIYGCDGLHVWGIPSVRRRLLSRDETNAGADAGGSDKLPSEFPFTKKLVNGRHRMEYANDWLGSGTAKLYATTFTPFAPSVPPEGLLEISHEHHHCRPSVLRTRPSSTRSADGLETYLSTVSLLHHVPYILS